MTEQKKVEREGAGAVETSRIAADPAPARRLASRRLSDAEGKSALGQNLQYHRGVAGHPPGIQG